MPTAVIATADLSVCPSITFQCFVQTNKDTIVWSSLPGRTITLVSEDVKFIRIFAGRISKLIYQRIGLYQSSRKINDTIVSFNDSGTEENNLYHTHSTSTGTGNPWAQWPLVSTDVRTIVDHSSLFSLLYKDYSRPYYTTPVCHSTILFWVFLFGLYPPHRRR